MGTEARLVADLGEGMYLLSAHPRDLREQDVNAQVLPPAKFNQLVENIRRRGALESFPYCACPGWDPTTDDGKADKTVEIVSGHHRVRASIQAGLGLIHVICDTAEITRSELVAKQLAHNALTGESDEQIVRQMIDMIDDPDDLLASGIDMDLLPMPGAGDDTNLSTPLPDMEWRNVVFTFLPHQFDRHKEVIDALDNRPDLVGVAPIECFAAFASALADYRHVSDVRSVGTIIHHLTEIAIREFDMAFGESPGDEDTWVPLKDLIGTARVPAAAADVIRQAVKQLEASGDIGPRNRWQVLEYACAELLASAT